MSTPTLILWFRQDLRLGDNPALVAAVKTGAPIIPLYILDDENANEWKMGGASRFWLHHALESLNDTLGGKLVIKKGNANKILDEIIKATDANAVYWNRCYEPWRTARDTKIKDNLKKSGLTIESFNGSLLWEPWEIKKDDGTPYKVFTPFYRRGCLKHSEPREPLKAPKKIDFAKHSIKNDTLDLLPAKPRWDKKMEAYWDISEKGAQQFLAAFLDEGLQDYKEGRNYPSRKAVSRLSPYLHFGQISPHQAWHAAKLAGLTNRWETNLDTFHSELGWREFAHSLLYFNPTLPEKPLQTKFGHFPWAKNKAHLKAWQIGQTGYPIVDAAMRELWETGYMHNRARMIVGSFLVKNLLLPWQDGEAWFWDCLVDADLASNSMGWQWISGCGADAAPYFRIFNPVTQGEKFDPKGEYVRHYVPEIAKLDDKYLHRPWDAPPLMLKEAGITLGKTYPAPIVDHSAARDRALEAFKSLKN
ncbi:MAG: deoxyribodipyrimidine photo-lyase [Alphaproteobacteria bacterium]|nr:deoxyribodipyrimidine photo-lyase [Alphaproteobacteria bacterium]